MSCGYLHVHTLLFPTRAVCREVEVPGPSRIREFLLSSYFSHCFSRLVSHRVKRTLHVQETRNAWYAIRRAARKAGVQPAFDP